MSTLMSPFRSPFAMAARRTASQTATSSAIAGPVADRVQRAQEMRVCIWTDYYGISARNAHRPALGHRHRSRQPWLPTSSWD